MDKPVVKKKGNDPFAEYSFSQPEEKQPPDSIQETAKPEAPAKAEPAKAETSKISIPISARLPAKVGEGEQVVGVNPLTQKPIIKSVEKKPFIKLVQEKKEDETEKMAEDLTQPDLTVAEMRKKQVQDITPVSNTPSEHPRELSRKDAADLARKIYEEKEKNQPWHRQLRKRLGLR